MYPPPGTITCTPPFTLLPRLTIPTSTIYRCTYNGQATPRSDDPMGSTAGSSSMQCFYYGIDQKPSELPVRTRLVIIIHKDLGSLITSCTNHASYHAFVMQFFNFIRSNSIQYILYLYQYPRQLGFVNDERRERDDTTYDLENNMDNFSKNQCNVQLINIC